MDSAEIIAILKNIFTPPAFVGGISEWMGVGPLSEFSSGTNPLSGIFGAGDRSRNTAPTTREAPRKSRTIRKFGIRDAAK